MVRGQSKLALENPKDDKACKPIDDLFEAIDSFIPEPPRETDKPFLMSVDARLVTTIKRYKPGAVYSTNFIRTRDTATPTALWRKKPLTIFDPKKLDEFVAGVMASKTKRFLIVAHNTTTPTLANMFIKEEKYKPLPESEYSKMWIIKIRNGKVKSCDVIEY